MDFFLVQHIPPHACYFFRAIMQWNAIHICSQKQKKWVSMHAKRKGKQAWKTGKKCIKNSCFENGCRVHSTETWKALK